MQANCGDPSQTPLIVASSLGLHYLPTSKNWTGLILIRYKLIFLQANWTLDLYWLGQWIIINPCS